MRPEMTTVTEEEAAQAARVVVLRGLLARAIDEGRDADARALLARLRRAEVELRGRSRRAPNQTLYNNPVNEHNAGETP